MKIQPERFTKVWLINSNEEGLSLFIQQKCPFALMHNSLFFLGGGGILSHQNDLIFKSDYAMSLLYIMIPWWYNVWHWVDRYTGFKRLKAIHSYQQVNSTLLGESIRVWTCKKRTIDLMKTGSLKDPFLS